MPALPFIMAILACGEGEAPCREVAIAPVRYASQAQCLAATEQELMRRDDILYPSVVAQCREAGGAPRLLRGNEVLLPDAPSPVSARQRIASRR